MGTGGWGSRAKRLGGFAGSGGFWRSDRPWDAPPCNALPSDARRSGCRGDTTERAVGWAADRPFLRAGDRPSPRLHTPCHAAFSDRPQRCSRRLTALAGARRDGAGVERSPARIESEKRLPAARRDRRRPGVGGTDWGMTTPKTLNAKTLQETKPILLCTTDVAEQCRVNLHRC